MRREPGTYLNDALDAAKYVAEFTTGKTFHDYESDMLLKSAVQRQFIIVGEALNQFAKLDPQGAAAIPTLRRVVDFRNLLVHGYAAVEDALVWQYVTGDVPELVGTQRRLVDPSGD